MVAILSKTMSGDTRLLHLVTLVTSCSDCMALLALKWNHFACRVKTWHSMHFLGCNVRFICQPFDVRLTCNAISGEVKHNTLQRRNGETSASCVFSTPAHIFIELWKLSNYFTIGTHDTQKLNISKELNNEVNWGWIAHWTSKVLVCFLILAAFCVHPRQICIMRHY